MAPRFLSARMCTLHVYITTYYVSTILHRDHQTLTTVQRFRDTGRHISYLSGYTYWILISRPRARDREGCWAGRTRQDLERLVRWVLIAGCMRENSQTGNLYLTCAGRLQERATGFMHNGFRRGTSCRGPRLHELLACRMGGAPQLIARSVSEEVKKVVARLSCSLMTPTLSDHKAGGKAVAWPGVGTLFRQHFRFAPRDLSMLVLCHANGKGCLG